MKKTIVVILLLVTMPVLLYPQTGSINNTLGTGGSFIIKYGTDTLLSLSQTNAYLSLQKSITLPATTASTLGVIFKGTNRFIHDYKASGTNGFNTFLGVNSGNFAMSGTGALASYNTAVGHSSLNLLVSGYSNSTFGYQSLYSTTSGYANSAFGVSALYSNIDGSENSAYGVYSLFSNTAGFQNSSFGTSSLFRNTAGSYNSAFGYYSLYSTVGGNENSAFGYYALYNNTSSSNSAFGKGSLYSNTSGAFNSAFGYNAGYNLTSGTNNAFIGFSAQPSSATVSNEITLGNSNVTTLRCQTTAITALSDGRDKKNIRDLPLGLDFLMNVRPRQFNWDMREWYENGKVDGSRMKPQPTAGFIAQELDEVQTKEHVEWLNLVLKSNPNRLEATPGNLLPIMVKAIQELKAENDALKNEVAKLRSSIAEEVKKEVREILLKVVQKDETKVKVSLNETKN